MKPYLAVISTILIFGCGPDKNEKSIDEQLEEDEKVSHSASCYLYSQDNSEIYMDISIANNKVSGELIYELHEKDRSAGNIKGELFGDTLIANYSFISEDIKSDREVAFLKSGNGWMQGSAEMIEKDGGMLFKDKSQLNFSPNILLKEVDCR